MYVLHLAIFSALILIIQHGDKPWLKSPFPSKNKTHGYWFLVILPRIWLAVDGYFKPCIIKAHLVAKCYHQTEGIDFNKTLSTIIKKATIHVILALLGHPVNSTLVGCQKCLSPWHDTLKEMVFMAHDSAGWFNWYIMSSSCELLAQKSLWPQADPHAWMEHFTFYILTIGFAASNANSSFLFCTLYWFFLKLSCTCISTLRQLLACEFQISDLGHYNIFTFGDSPFDQWSLNQSIKILF